MYSIVPFEEHHQPEIEEMMGEIQREFDLPFRNPNSVSVSEYVESGNFFWVAIHEDQIVGTIGLSCFDSETGVLRNMFVAKEHRGGQTTVAKSLLDMALDQAKDLGYTNVYLGTMDQFKAAQRFYSKNKFVQIPKTDLPETMSFNPVDTLFYVLRNEK
ncbi:GNAT family N-acetyltransferase [Fluviicola taffensis]|uniref:GNAT family N-acetyltransferase n=1 Tax=Fluviicola taffensis TaxID=191579 RepID=UPI00313772B1